MSEHKGDPDLAEFERDQRGAAGGAGDDERAAPGRAPEREGAGPFHGEGDPMPPPDQQSPSEGVSESDPATGL
jgi:hypothetical protein